MKRIVIESPFGRNVDGSKCTPAEYARNARYLDRCIRDSLSRGEAPYASHGFFPAPGRLDDTILAQREQGIAAGLAWAEAAHEAAIYIDHGETEGMTRAIAKHVDREIPIGFRSIGPEPEIPDSGDLDTAAELAKYAQLEAALRWLPAGSRVDYCDIDLFLEEVRALGWDGSVSENE